MSKIAIKYQQSVSHKLKVRVLKELKKDEWEENVKQEVSKPLNLSH